MRIHLAVLAVLAACAPVGAQSPSRIANVEARRTTSLNGRWRAIVDPYENGYYDSRLQPSKDGFFRDAKPKDKSELIEYNFDASGQLDVPGERTSRTSSTARAWLPCAGTRRRPST